MTDQQPPASPGAAPRKRRGLESMGDMVRSMLVVVAIVLVIFVVQIRNDPPSAVRRVPVAASLQQARVQAPYDVAGPVGLPRTWRATSVRFAKAGPVVTWHIGYVTPREDYAALEQSNGPEHKVVIQTVAGSHEVGRIDIGGATWHKMAGGSPEPRALVLYGSAATTIVAGRASWAELRTLATALRPVLTLD